MSDDSRKNRIERIVILRQACGGELQVDRPDSQVYVDIAQSLSALDISIWRSPGGSASDFAISTWEDDAAAKAFLRSIATGIVKGADLLEGGLELRATSQAGMTWLHGLVLQPTPRPGC